VQDKQFEIDSVEEEQRLELCFNIFPKGNSLIHMFCMQGISLDKDTSEVSDFIHATQSTRRMFDICKEHDDFDLLGANHENN